MSSQFLNKTLGELVTSNPASARVFDTLGLDYCCGGRVTLADACAQRGIETQVACDMLANVESTSDQSQEAETKWAERSLTELADHIESTHHAYLKGELPRLAILVTKVAAVHGEWAPWLRDLAETYNQFIVEMECHTMKEERVLFPAIRAMESSRSCPNQFQTIKNPIAVMEQEHESAGRALARMRELSNGFTPPADACNSFRAMLAGLAELESDTHRHVHKENSILFPRAASLEAELCSRAL